MHDQRPLRAATWPMSRTCPFSPPPDYAGLREHPGLPGLTGPSGRTVFVAARHEDVRAVLGDARFSSDRASGGEGRRATVELCVLLVAAGLETTATMAALGVLTLLEHPGQLALITAVRRIPTLRLATPRDELRFVNGSAFSVSALPVTW
ncbi:hypothetical protein [Streptomyces telluris]|uniref:Cytochrome P450 n=1 Tax=Streptomyces telluris TaxID=2720021 RepID=A0A9X2RKH6_9ACTN|nr:hypothetical protein [Streptomyces telluris]MCQ8769783.1 hypothetical protein [Streptomyces telluris]NJP81348.1 hypothetical protein [Streptomyces telluris]